MGKVSKFLSLTTILGLARIESFPLGQILVL